LTDEQPLAPELAAFIARLQYLDEDRGFGFADEDFLPFAQAVALHRLQVDVDTLKEQLVALALKFERRGDGQARCGAAQLIVLACLAFEDAGRAEASLARAGMSLDDRTRTLIGAEAHKLPPSQSSTPGMSVLALRTGKRS
jgi:hypothetical protein